jgi:hypothetical protein
MIFSYSLLSFLNSSREPLHRTTHRRAPPWTPTTTCGKSQFGRCRHPCRGVIQYHFAQAPVCHPTHPRCWKPACPLAYSHRGRRREPRSGRRTCPVVQSGLPESLSAGHKHLAIVLCFSARAVIQTSCKSTWPSIQLMYFSPRNFSPIYTVA